MFQQTVTFEYRANAGRFARRVLNCVVMAGSLAFLPNLNVLAQEITTSTGTRSSPSPATSRTRSRRYTPRKPQSTAGISRGSTSEPSDDFVDLGDTFAQKSYWVAAEVAYKEAISLSPHNADAYAGLGNLYNDQGKIGDAYGPLNRAKSIDSSNPRANYGLGYAQMRQQKHQQAVGYFKQAIASDPNFAGAYLDLGFTYLALNDKASALSQYEKLKEIDAEMAQELLTEINKK